MQRDEKTVNVNEIFAGKEHQMYFTETPRLQSIEAMMKTIPHLPQTEAAAEQRERKMRLRFSSKAHFDRFMGFFKDRKTNPLSCESEFVAAIYLMTADHELWDKIKSAVVDENINFRRIKLGVLAADSYALYKTAKDIIYKKQGLTPCELRSMIFDRESTADLILTAYRVAKSGFGYIESDKFGFSGMAS